VITLKNWLSRTFWIVFGLIVGGVLTAQSFERWQRSQVVPVVLDKPSLGYFVPVDGSSFDGSWTKDQIVPMCEVKPGIGGFVPVDGSSIGNTWPRQNVEPVVLVKPYLGEFAPAEDSSVNVPSAAVAPSAPVVSPYAGGSTGHWIKSKASNGAIITLEDGSVWEIQSLDRIETASWLPISNVTIFRNSAGIGDYKYVLVNTDDGAKAAAKYLGRR
jgi:hypothetical protein